MATDNATCKSDLQSMATAINEHHTEVLRHARSALESARVAGELLLHAKALLPHGEWLPWLEAKCQVSNRQCQRYIRIAERWGSIEDKSQTIKGALLGIADSRESNATPGTHLELPPIMFTSTVDNLEWDDGDPDEDPQPVANKPHVSRNSGENEWYTPTRFLEAARVAMGSIDCDPASSDVAQGMVKADCYFTKDDYGLSHEWFGNVWLNPPYAQPLINLFSEAVSAKYQNGKISSAIVLVNNATETAWFQRMANAASAVCFPRARIRFLDMDGEPSGAPLQGQAALYLGSSPERFIDAFREFGWTLATEVSQ